MPSRHQSRSGDGAPRQPPRKRAHRLHHRLRLFEVRQVSGLVDQLDPRAGNPLRELLRIGRRDDAVRLAPDDQRRRRNAVRALA